MFFPRYVNASAYAQYINTSAYSQYLNTSAYAQYLRDSVRNSSYGEYVRSGYMNVRSANHHPAKVSHTKAPGSIKEPCSHAVCRRTSTLTRTPNPEPRTPQHLHLRANPPRRRCHGGTAQGKQGGQQTREQRRRRAAHQCLRRTRSCMLNMPGTYTLDPL